MVQRSEPLYDRHEVAGKGAESFPWVSAATDRRWADGFEEKGRRGAGERGRLVAPPFFLHCSCERQQGALSYTIRRRCASLGLALVFGSDGFCRYPGRSKHCKANLTQEGTLEGTWQLVRNMLHTISSNRVPLTHNFRPDALMSLPGLLGLCSATAECLILAEKKKTHTHLRPPTALHPPSRSCSRSRSRNRAVDAESPAAHLYLALGCKVPWPSPPRFGQDPNSPIHAPKDLISVAIA